jgi:hypothetical protein
MVVTGQALPSSPTSSRGAWLETRACTITSMCQMGRSRRWQEKRSTIAEKYKRKREELERSNLEEGKEKSSESARKCFLWSQCRLLHLQGQASHRRQRGCRVLFHMLKLPCPNLVKCVSADPESPNQQPLGSQTGLTASV